MDIYILSLYPELKRSFAKKLILNKGVKINGIVVKKPNYKIKPPVEIELDSEILKTTLLLLEKNSIPAVNIPFDIVFEDSNLLVVNKPCNLVTHPSYGHGDDSLLSRVIYYAKIKPPSEIFKPRPINRLDKGTSGIVLFSKNIDSHNYFSVQFKKRNIHKEYIAIVTGDIGEKLKNSSSITIRSNLTKSPNNLRYKSTNVFNSEPAESEIEYLGKLENNLSAVKIIPKTGRTHQIRVHLSEMGYPILGDLLYDGAEYKRLMLHSYRLRVNNIDNNYLELKAELPLEFKQILNNLIEKI